MIRKTIENIIRYLFYLAVVPVFLMMILTVIDVTGRYFFNNPLTGTVELIELFLPIFCVLSWAYVQVKKGHITIDLVINSMPPRAQTALNIFTSIIAIFIISLIAWQTIPMVSLSNRMHEGTDLLGLPIWPFKLTLFFGLFFLGLQLILDIIDYSRELRRQAHATR